MSAWLWEGNEPNSLVEICTKFCVEHLETFCYLDCLTQKYCLREGITLPNEICERMLTARQQSDRPIDDDFLRIFKDPRTTRLRRVNLSKSCVTDAGLGVVLRHQLMELDISDSDKITEDALKLINELGSDLRSLNIGTSVHIFPDPLLDNDTLGHLLLPQIQAEPHSSSSTNNPQRYIMRTPNLRKLTLRELSVPLEDRYFPLLLRPLQRLQCLDLSGCFNLGTLDYLTQMDQLVSLTLYNVPRLQNTINAICKLKTLRHLDVSQHIEKHGVYRHPNQLLSQIAESLPHLVHLDISGTNLAGTGVAEHDHSESEERSNKWLSPTTSALTDIPGLRSRVNNPLGFLGLYGTSHDACHRHHIPAKQITGDANERQTLMAAHAYIDRAEILQKVLNDLFQIVRYETCYNSKQALEAILLGMEKHLGDKHIQISGSASLFYILKGEIKKKFTVQIKHKLIKSVLDAMWEHKYDPTMMRNGCLTLCQFKIPRDVLFDYKRLVKILLHVVYEDDQEDFVQRIGIYLLNSLACQVDGSQKQLVGDLGAIEIMLHIISNRLQRHLCDDVMEIAWSTMWNVTDETPVNCRRFLQGHGMTYFLDCLRMFPNKADLLRNMMGLLGNVAEVQELRPQLMTEEFISVFSELLDSTSDGIEVSYNAAGVLSHIASDGRDSWTISNPRREDVLSRMVNAIQRWNLHTKRNINYRSFEPILRLLYIHHTREAQYWAVWALANLTCVYPEKYCSLIQEEHGIEILKGLINEECVQHPTLEQRIRNLALLVVNLCESRGGHTVEAMDE